MISGRNIICFASGWDYHPTSKHHVMRALSKQNHVIWVNWHATRRPSLDMEDIRTAIGKLRQIRRGAQRASDQITVITPPQMPLPASPLARRINASLAYRAISKVLRGLPDRPIQLWSFAPDVEDLVGRFGEELVLYYCVDAFGEFPGYDRAVIERREQSLIDKSDVVLATSKPLFEAKRTLHPNVHSIEHGVDHAHLSRAVTEDLPIPEDLRSIPKPVVGFVGVLGKWVDLDLMVELARRNPALSVAVIGPLTSSRSLEQVPNLYWLGPKDHQELPYYLRGFDVGLIPFCNTALTYNANPIKLHEYLAAGVPVVSSPMPAVRSIENSVWIADDVDATAKACMEAIKHNSEAERRHRSQLMVAESWSARLEQINRIVRSTLGQVKETALTEPKETETSADPAETMANCVA